MRQINNRYEKGRPGEIWVRARCQERGWYVMTTADYSGKEDNKAPSLLSDRARLVVPDLLVFKNRKAIWIEVKDFAAPTMTHTTGTWDHGIKERLARDYVQVQEITGIKCLLMICEKRGGVVLAAKISDIMPSARRSLMNGSKMVFWNRALFQELWLYDREEAKRMAEESCRQGNKR